MGGSERRTVVVLLLFSLNAPGDSLLLTRSRLLVISPSSGEKVALPHQ